MKTGEWSRSRYWLCHFLHNRHTRASVDPSQVGEDAQPLAGALNAWSTASLAAASGNRRTIERAADRCADDPAFVQSLRLFVKEQQYHATLLRDAAGARKTPSWRSRWTEATVNGLRRTFTLRFELAILMLNQLVAVTLSRLVLAATTDAALRAIAEQLLHDARRHVAFHSERLTTEFVDFNFVRRNLRRWRLRLMCFAALVIAAVQYRRLFRAAGTSPVTFLQSGWTSFNHVLERMVPYRRAALLRRLTRLRQHRYDAPDVASI